MDKDELQILVAQGLSSWQIADKLEIGQTTVRYWLKKHALTTLTKTVGCKYCGQSDPNEMVKSGKDRICRTVCKKCHNQNTIKRFKDTKSKAVEYKGGSCVNCGYDVCLNALEFHHVNPDEKDPEFHKMKCWSWDRLKVELDKCTLVCANCHREKHMGLW